MLSFWWNFNHWLHRKLSFWQLSVQPVMKISSKWRHFCFSDNHSGVNMVVAGVPVPNLCPGICNYQWWRKPVDAYIKGVILCPCLFPDSHRSTPIKRRSNTVASDRSLIDVDIRVFAVLNMISATCLIRITVVVGMAIIWRQDICNQHDDICCSPQIDWCHNVMIHWRPSLIICLY